MPVKKKCVGEIMCGRIFQGMCGREKVLWEKFCVGKKAVVVVVLVVVVVIRVVVGMCVAGVIRRGIWCMGLESSGRVGFCVWEILWGKFLQGKISGSKICGRRLWGWSEWVRVQTWG
jgi:hypothetical protein